jgi:hypothetical protein
MDPRFREDDGGENIRAIEFVIGGIHLIFIPDIKLSNPPNELDTKYRHIQITFPHYP